MTTKKQEIGKLGEDAAVKYLENGNYQILERNYRRPWGEIDVIALDKNNKNELVFVEVKAQNGKFEWKPEENINHHKKHQLSRIIETYLKEKNVPEKQEWRVDALAIELDFGIKKAKINHIKNIILRA